MDITGYKNIIQNVLTNYKVSNSNECINFKAHVKGVFEVAKVDLSADDFNQFENWFTDLLFDEIRTK